jgi:hypothetical protein
MAGPGAGDSRQDGRHDNMNNMKRMRGRSHRHSGGGSGGGGQQYRHSGHQPMNRNHVFDSNGPDMRLRGTAQQLFEKYLQLGRDATSAGDRVMAESYFQHAEHYFRILNAMSQAQQQGSGGGAGQPQHQHRRPSQPGPAEVDGVAPPGEGDQPELNGHANGHAASLEAELEAETAATGSPDATGREPN